jgi:hypothetical protein
MPEISKQTVFKKVWHLYIDGFKDLSGWGRKLWIIILIKLFILFAIIRLFFMPDFLKQNYKNDEQRARHVLENLTKSN